MNCTARVWATLLACCLVIPAIGLVLQNNADLQRFHTRRLNPAPERESFLEDPVKYFALARRWFADRAFPIIQAAHLEKNFLYFILRTTPAERITLGEDGHVFATAGNNGELYTLLASTCLEAHRPGSARALEQALSRGLTIGNRRKLRVDVVVVPTSGSIYGDKLPDSVPARYRQACLQRTAGKSALLDVVAPQGVAYVYPLREMLAVRSDEAFFPRGNWHPTGLSLKVVRDTYLARLGASPPGAESLERGEAPGELLVEFGIEERDPVYFLRNAHVVEEESAAADLRAALAPLFKGERVAARVFSNSQPVLEDTVLMLSDSFGDWASEAFAGAFRKLIQVNTNYLNTKSKAVITAMQRREAITRLLILVEEGNVGRVAGMLG